MTRSLLRPCDSQLSLINNNSTFVLNVLMLVKMQYNEIQLRLLYASHCVNALNFAEILRVNH